MPLEPRGEDCRSPAVFPKRRVLVLPGWRTDHVRLHQVPGEARQANLALLNEGDPVDTEIFTDYEFENTPYRNVTTGNVAGAPRPPGDLFTYRNRILDADPLEIPGGRGWAVTDIVNTTEEISFSTGPATGKISTANEPNGELFLANLYFSNIPEPTSAALIASALIGSCTVRRKLHAR